MILFGPSISAGEPQIHQLQSPDGTNALRLCDYYLDVTVSGEGAAGYIFSDLTAAKRTAEGPFQVC